MPMAPPLLDDVVVVVPTTNAKKRKLGSGGEPRKPKFLKKILDDDKATKTTSFKNRIRTLMTKSYQLETLCGVSVCVLCYGSDGKVETWPKDRAEAEARIRGYKEASQKEKRESHVVALLEGTKKSLLRKESACFSDLADPERLDAVLKRIEDKMRVLTSNGDQRNMEVAATSISNDEFICLDELVGPNFAFGPSLLGGDSGGIGFCDLGLVENGNMGLHDVTMGHNGVDSRKVEKFGNLIIQDKNRNVNSPFVLDNYIGMDNNGTSCSFEDDFFLGLDGFFNPVQGCSNNSQFMVDNSCMEAGTSWTLDDDFVPDLDLTSFGHDLNCNNSMKVEDFGVPIEVATNNSLPVGDNSCMKNNSTSCCSFVDYGIYLDDLIGPNFTSDPSFYGGERVGLSLVDWNLEERKVDFNLLK